MSCNNTRVQETDMAAAGVDTFYDSESRVG